MTVEDTIERVARAIVHERSSVRIDTVSTVLEVALARAAISSLRPGDNLGNGLVAVPKEPTRAMVEAGKYAPAWDVQETIWSSDADGDWVSPAPVKMYPAYVYRDMIAAASLPSPPVTKQEERE